MTVLKYTQAFSAQLDGMLAARMLEGLLQQEFVVTKQRYAVLVTGS